VLTWVPCAQELAPKEASIWFQMGKIYKKKRLNDDALAHFRIALDLKPSSNDLNLIKSAIEKLNLADDEQEEEI
jgi:anaphase-promoting complex subunit 3